MPYAQSPECRLYYEFARQPGAPVVLLSNSLGTDLSMWEPQLSTLQQKFSVLRYDARGHGKSSVPEGDYTLSDLGSDVLFLLDSLEIPRVHFCGLSLGGMVGQWFATRCPDRLDRLVLANTAAHIGTEDGWNQRIREVNRAGMPGITDAILARWFTPAFRSSHASSVAAIAQVLNNTSAQGYVRTCAALRDADFRQELGALPGPVMVLYGTEDAVTTSEDARYLSTTIPGARSLGLPAAHLSNMEAAPAFSAALLNFLAGDDTHG